MVDMGKLPDSIYSRSEDMNAQGQVVGSSYYLAGNYRAFVWAPASPNSNNGTMLDLNSLLEPNTGAGWTLTIAKGIDDRGQIVGFGNYYDPDGPGGVTPIARAFLLTPISEPTTAVATSLLAGGSAPFFRRRRSNRHSMPPML
jgi:probable HAF family extracellular repeat protein